MNYKNIEQLLRRIIARNIQEDPETIDVSCSLGELGIDSLGYVDIAASVQKELGIHVKPEILFEHSSGHETIAYIARLLEDASHDSRTMQVVQNNVIAAAHPAYGPRDIAIIGTALRLPGAQDLASLWELVSKGESRFSGFPVQRIADAGQEAELPSFLRGGFVDDADAFDAAFFGISPREALAMDPQQRLLMECAWHAFEDAGYNTTRLAGSDTAVFIGASSFDYYELLVKTQAARSTHIGTGVSHAILANRLSQYFNLKGASEAIDTACASSLVALLRGVNALRHGESQLALVGGVNLLASTTPFQVFADAGMLSQEGVCSPFDDSAAGYVRGEGVACMVLKPAQAAIQDGDRILAVIKGGAVQHSGRTQSLTAPNPEAQANVIAAALEDANVDPAGIGYIEAHGTGTALGDPIEIHGLQKAFGRMHEKWGRAQTEPHFFIGSIKAQIGHLEAAAGLAGVLKVVASLLHRSIPGSPYLNRLNRHIELKESVFRIPHQTLPWQGTQNDVTLPSGPRRAGVSSFGFGGTNTHIVLEEAPPLEARTTAPSQPRLFVLSAKNGEALCMQCTLLARHLAGRKPIDHTAEQAYLEDIAFTLRHGRTPLSFRLAAIASSLEELIDLLQRYTHEGKPVAGIITGQSRGASHEVLEAPSDEANLLQWLRAEADNGNLRSLAQSWTQGLSIDWEQVLPRDGASLTTLPNYPFARERFWVKTAAAAAPALPASTEILRQTAALYQTRWSPVPLTASESPQFCGTLLVFVAGQRGQCVAEAVHRLLPQHPMHLLICPQADMTQLMSDKIPEPVGVVLDLTPLDAAGCQQMGVPRKLELLRHFTGSALKRGEALRIIHASCGLQDVDAAGVLPTSLSGAQDAGFFEHLGAEYKRCQSKTIDFASARFDAATMAGHLLDELQRHDGNNALAYVDGQRFTRSMGRIIPPVSTMQWKKVETALITGGTGDIGLCIARDLVERGCRALLLTGRSELSPQKLAIVRELELHDVQISFYRGELNDAPALHVAIERFRAAHGAIQYVFHCAGTADQNMPAFFQKTAASIAKVMAPKVDALQVLHELFLQEPPQAFVLFSSIAAILPKSAAGVLDYAAANRFLDLFAHYQHAQGRRYYRSIQWTKWRDLGLAKWAGVKSSSSGQALAVEQCLEALHAILTAGESLPPSVCVLADDDTILTADSSPEVDGTASAQQQKAAYPAGMHLESVRWTLRTLVAKELETPESRLDDEASFEELGIDSIVLMGLITALEAWLGQVVDPQELIQCNSIAAVADYLAAKLSPATMAKTSTLDTTLAATPNTPLSPSSTMHRHGTGPFKVAVIGMACRFPGATDKEAFWRNLKAGIDSVGKVPATRWDSTALYATQHAQGHSISQWGGFLEEIEWINPKLFGMNAADAADVDPLVRLFTECSLEAAVSSAVGAEGLKGRRIGVFAGARAGGYAERIAQPGKHSVTGIGQNFVAAHVSHLLDLRGPSLVIDSACSSSLAAIHLACQSLLCGDSEMALAGGVEVLLDEKPYLFLSAAHALSPEGRCRPFDANANGFVPGEGVGCVLLKPLEQALADGDPVYAVIEGSAMNNDGHTLGITTPGVTGQVDAIERALRNAQVSSRDISYIEAHGTGTLIGDPIELQALARAFETDPPPHCAVGSVKSNLGHLLSAAGVASFIKVALSLHHKVLPPTLHCEQVNPRFDFERTPFFPVRQAQQWDSATGVRRAGISAFGFGKTNVHMILAERPELASRPDDHATRTGQKDEKILAWHAAKPSKTIESTPPVAELLAISNVFFEELSQE